MDDDIVRTRIKSVLDGAVPPQIRRNEAAQRIAEQERDAARKIAEAAQLAAGGKPDKTFIITTAPGVEIEAKGKKGLAKLVYLLGHQKFLGVRRLDKK